ncbi:MAG: AMP-binding enzyme [bacterium]
MLKAGIGVTAGSPAAATLVAELVRRVRDEVGPVASFQRCHIVTRLPKTRSGKVLRATMRAIADGRPFDIPATIEDPAVIDEIRAVLEDRA